MPFVADRRLEDLLNPQAGARCSRRIAKAGTDRLVANTKANTPVNTSPFSSVDRPPGKLRDGIKGTRVTRTPTPGGDRYEGHAQTFDPIAEYVEWNTKPHIIRPRADRAPASVVETGKPRGTVQDGRAALRIPMAGGAIFRREVHHPGTTGQHMFAIGAALTEAELGQLAKPALAEFARELVPSRTGRVFGAGRFS